MNVSVDGLTVVQEPDMGILVKRGNKPVLHLHCTKKLKRSELVRTVQDTYQAIRASEAAKRVCRYTAVCPLCGFENRGLDLSETSGVMECERCGTIVELLPLDDGKAIPFLTKEICAKLISMQTRKENKPCTTTT